jgi:hypothetical protein
MCRSAAAAGWSLGGKSKSVQSRAPRDARSNDRAAPPIGHDDTATNVVIWRRAGVMGRQHLFGLLQLDSL